MAVVPRIHAYLLPGPLVIDLNAATETIQFFVEEIQNFQIIQSVELGIPILIDVLPQISESAIGWIK